MAQSISRMEDDAKQRTRDKRVSAPVDYDPGFAAAWSMQTSDLCSGPSPVNSTPEGLAGDAQIATALMHYGLWQKASDNQRESNVKSRSHWHPAD